MKANTPEKIWLTSQDFQKLSGVMDKNSIEYTRTDVFIEKSVNFLEMLENGFTIIDNITHTNYDKEQLVEAFKDYMKGD